MDDLTLSEISQYLSPDVAARVQLYDTLTSTNTVLQELAQNGAPSGTVIVADKQTAGRGRFSRSFHSPKGTGVYVSVLLDAPKKQDLSIITALAAVAVCDAIENAVGIRPQIKWVNDLILGGKKIVGILAEMSFSSGQPGKLILGVGINTKKAHFPDELKNIAGSLEDFTPESVSRAHLTAELINRLLELNKPVDIAEQIKKYRADCFTLGKDVDVSGGSFSGTGRAVGLTDDCGLIVECDDGVRRTLRFGEASVK